MSNITKKVYAELGLQALANSPRDVKILCLQRVARMMGYGSSTIVLTLFLTGLGHDPAKTGVFMTLTLLGDVGISLCLTMVADRVGRRLVLLTGSLLMTASGIVFALCSQYWILVLASVFGVISPSGFEVGPFKAVEESTLAQLVRPDDRSSVLAWYLLFGTLGAALGSLFGGWLVDILQTRHDWSPVSSYRAIFWAYAAFGAIKFLIICTLSFRCELPPPTGRKQRPDEQRPLLQPDADAVAEPPSQELPAAKVLRRSWYPRLSRQTVSLLIKLCLIFAIDNAASGIASTSWLVLFFHEKFGLPEGQLGSLFFTTGIIASGSNLISASLARRIGLIRAMVFTHLPASAALIFLPIINNPLLAMALLIFRSSCSNMDGPPRQAFLAAAVLPEERTAVMGIINVVRTLSQSLGPILTGFLAQRGKFALAILLAGVFKVTYDLLMFVMFVSYKPVERKATPQVEEEVEREREEGTEREFNAP